MFSSRHAYKELKQEILIGFPDGVSSRSRHAYKELKRGIGLVVLRRLKGVRAMPIRN